MEKFQKLSKFFFTVLSLFISFAILGSIFMLPSFASSEIPSGYDEITFTGKMLYDMFVNGDFIITSTFTVTSGSMYEYNMSNHSRTTISAPSSSIITRYSAENVNGNLIFFYAPYSFLIRANSSVRSTYNLSFPFPYRLEGSLLRSPQVGFAYAADGVISSLHFIGKKDTNIIFDRSYNLGLSTPYWSSNTLYQRFFSKYNWIPGAGTSYDTSTSGIKGSLTNIAYINGVSTDDVLDTLSFQFEFNSERANTSGNEYNYYSGAFITWQSGSDFKVLVPKDISSEVLEYLDIITSDSPSATQQARIDVLRQKFNNAKQTMQDIDDNLHVDMPDTDDLALTAEQNDQIQEAVEYAVSPLFDNPVIVTLVSGALVFALIKLLLFGGGPS